ncbi:hypothetical protein KIM67_00520 [Flagellimonas sp. 389]|uniref:hypothetical protein n=1 Tax=Flagellimonas sp. 389 TaxID=2835862 RepID=UPI001BD2D137|nr:hypothetical protein [Flagellimonas sp. 389]MBS9460873.1 hypothetical protein [Flagellimonas sp. 389]
MSPDFNNSIELLEFVHKEPLYENFLLQLKKDFSLVNIKMDFSLDVLPADLKQLVHEKIYFLLLEKHQQYLNLLYVVDIPEQAIQRISAMDEVDVSDEVCFLLLKREWQKVWFKHRYSS